MLLVFKCFLSAFVTYHELLFLIILLCVQTLAEKVLPQMFTIVCIFFSVTVNVAMQLAHYIIKHFRALLG